MGACQSRMNKINDEGYPPSSTPKFTTVESGSTNITNSNTFRSEIHIDEYEVIHLLAPADDTPPIPASDTPPLQLTCNGSKTLYSMDKDTLASMIKYTLENEPAFTKYKDDAMNVYNAFINYKINGKMLQLTRPQFAKELPWIKGIIISKLYKYLRALNDEQLGEILNEVKGINDSNTPSAEGVETTEGEKYTNIKLPAYLTQIDIIKLNKDELKMYDKHEFVIFVYILCVINEFDMEVIESISLSLVNMNMNGREFMEMKRVQFCRKLRQCQIKAAVASKLFKLIRNNTENIGDYCRKNHVSLQMKLSCHELIEIAITDFQKSAYRMLYDMNEAMKTNIVNGLILVEQYRCRDDLEVYLKENVREKNVNILTDIVWKDYLRDKEKQIAKIKEYNRKQLLKYFISLYMHNVKVVMMRNGLDEDKCMELKRKGVCDIFIKECGFSIGVATNIADRMYKEIDV